MKNNKKDVRWLNGVPFSERTPELDDEQGWKYYLEVTKLARGKLIKELHKRSGSKNNDKGTNF